MKGFLYIPAMGSYIKFEDDRGVLVDVKPQDEKSAEYIPIEIIGRFEPLLVYQGSSERLITITMSLYFGNPDKLRALVNRLRSLVYPVRRKGSYTMPPVVILRWGNNIKVRGVVRDISINYENSVYDTAQNAPYNVDISMTIVEQNSVPVSFQKVWSLKE